MLHPIHQSERAECGLVCLAMIAAAHHLRTDITSLRARFPVSTKGTTLKSIVEVAKALKFETRAIRCEVGDLRQVRLPAILHWRMNHFVVLERVGRRGTVTILDPAVGRVPVSQEDLSASFTGVVLEVWPAPDFQRQDTRRKLRLGAVIPLSRDIIRALVTIAVCALGVEVLLLGTPLLQQLIIDDALVTGDTELLVVIAAALAIFLVGQAVVAGVRAIVMRNLSSSLSLLVPAHAFGRMVQLPASWFESRAPADVVNRLESGNTIHHTITTTVITSLIDGVVGLIALGMMALYHPLLALLCTLAMCAYLALRLLRYGTLRQASQGMLMQQARVAGVLWETIRGIATIKQFNGQGDRMSRYMAALSHSVRFQNRVGTSTVGFNFLHDAIFAAEKVAILYLGSRAVIDQKLSIGMLTAFLSFREHFVAKGTNLVNAYFEFRMLDIQLDRLADVLLTAPESDARLPFIGDRGGAGRIELRNVTFRYGVNEPEVLKDVSLIVEPGEIVAIIGPSGAGKSTLFKLMSGQLKPGRGEILIDGVSIGAMGLDQWRDTIGVVRQDDLLFAGTITENVAFADANPDHARVRDAAEKAHVFADIMRMPMGFNTLLGEIGTGLSGGQAQRIMLARALYKRPRILLLDEATSSLDVANERHIGEALAALTITQVIVAHRQETIARATRVVDIMSLQKGSQAAGLGTYATDAHVSSIGDRMLT
jgi:ATP-binding cassette, subfamily B, bacterial CvaB/MchF/RaxB